MTVFAVLRLDPITQLLIWVNSPGVFGVVLLQVMVAVSVIVFFWRDRRGHSVLRVVVAPALAGLLLLAALGLMIRNVTLLTGASTTVNAVIVSITPLTALVGYLIAKRLQRTRPEVYRNVGRRDVD